MLKYFKLQHYTLKQIANLKVGELTDQELVDAWRENERLTNGKPVSLLEKMHRSDLRSELFLRTGCYKVQETFNFDYDDNDMEKRAIALLWKGNKKGAIQ